MPARAAVWLASLIALTPWRRFRYAGIPSIELLESRLLRIAVVAIALALARAHLATTAAARV